LTFQVNRPFRSHSGQPFYIFFDTAKIQGLFTPVKNIRKLMVVILLFMVVIQQPTVVFIRIGGELFL